MFRNLLHAAEGVLIRAAASTQPLGAKAPVMVDGIEEADWKHLRRLHAVALERFCRRAIEEIGGATSDRAGDYHRCFLEVFALVNERNQELARTFDDPRRSNAMTLLANMMEGRLLSEAEFSQFSPETRDAVEAILRLRGAASTSR